MAFIRYGEYPETEDAREHEARSYDKMVSAEHSACDHYRDHGDLKSNMTRYRGSLVSRVQAVWQCSADRISEGASR